MVLTHPPLATDSFTLYLKGTILLGKVKTFNVRFKMRYTDGMGPSSGSTYTAAYQETYSYGAPSSTSGSKIDPRETAEFQFLDNLIRTFPSSIPKEFKDAVGMDIGMKLDPVLYVAHLLPHV